MKITVISDIDSAEFSSNLDLAVNELCKNDYMVEVFDLNKLDINFCIGCFGCWVKTPGKCVFDDDMTAILKSQMRSEWVIYFSKMTAGTVGYKTKNVIDRTIPIVLPHIGVFEGEFHHKKRYNKYPNRAFMILNDENIDDKNMGILKEIADKNAKNMHCDKHLVKVFGIYNIKESLDEIIGC